MQWSRPALKILSREPICVRVVVAQVKGSTPREVGACIVVGATTAWGTIGGGALEFMALKQARDILLAGSVGAVFTVIPLGPNLGQCCGGQVTLCFQPLRREQVEMVEDAMGRAIQHVLLTSEAAIDHCCSVAAIHELQDLRLRSPYATQLLAGSKSELLKTSAGRLFSEPLNDGQPQLFLFGAGHVGREIVHILGRHRFDIYWLDQRSIEFPAIVPDNTRQMLVSDPIAHVALANEGSNFLVMTHDHSLDLALCNAILRKRDFRFLGLIGSATKFARFKRRLQDIGHDPDEIARITCPIGIPGIFSKRPEVIAASVVAQLLAL